MKKICKIGGRKISYPQENEVCSHEIQMTPPLCKCPINPIKQRKIMIEVQIWNSYFLQS